MDLIFLGGILNHPTYKKKSKKYIQNAADVLQKNIIDGFFNKKNKPVNIINSVFIGSFPTYYEDLIVKTYKWHSEKKSGENIGFINFPVIKNISRGINISLAISKWARNKKKNKVLFVYSMHTPFLIAAKIAKKINPDIKVVLMVPDLPEYMSSYSNKLLIFFKNIDTNIIKKLSKYVDYYILLTKEMASVLELDQDEFLVIEGMINEEDVYRTKRKDASSVKKTIVYTGSLNAKYGIKTLLEAFQNIVNPNYELILCGAGDSDNYIKELVKKDKRIKFVGLISREEAIKYQVNATCLINPRPNEGEYVKYSFPSKTMEYLLSGRPTLAYKLPGIPDEYDNHIFYIEQNTSISMAEKLMEVCERDEEELYKFGRNAKDFVLSYKNNKVQSEKILQFIENKLPQF